MGRSTLLPDGRKTLSAKAGARSNFSFGWLEKNDASAGLAMIYALTGEAEKAITMIEHLLTVPSQLTRVLEYDADRTEMALGMGSAAEQSAFPENHREPGTANRLLAKTSNRHLLSRYMPLCLLDAEMGSG